MNGNKGAIYTCRVCTSTALVSWGAEPTEWICPECRRPDWRAELELIVRLLATEVSSPGLSAEWNRVRLLLLTHPPTDDEKLTVYG